MGPIKVMLVDDHAVVRMGFKLLLAACEDIEVVGEADSGETAYVRYAELKPDVVVMDLSMPGMGGIEAVRRLTARDKGVRILALSAHEDTAHPKRVLKAGATGYLVEEMVTGAVAEILLGLRRDPVYGVTLTLGMGGVTAEVLADTMTLVLPATETQVLAALQTLRLWPLLDGYRGRAKADMAAVARIAVALGQKMLADGSLEEIEINPILVRAQGAVAVDALIRKV